MRPNPSATSDSDEAEEIGAEHRYITMEFPNGNTLKFLKSTLHQEHLEGTFFDRSSQEWPSTNELFVEDDYELFNTFIVPYIRFNLLPDMTGSTNQTIAHLKKIVDFLSLTEVIKHLENTQNGNENPTLTLTDPDIKDGVATITFFLVAHIKSENPIEKIKLTAAADITICALHSLLSSFNLITKEGERMGASDDKMTKIYSQTLLWRGENMRGQPQKSTRSDKGYHTYHIVYPRDELLVADTLKGNKPIVCFPDFSSPKLPY